MSAAPAGALLLGNTVALVTAITYDKTVNAIGPFELTEYVGLVMVWVALAGSAWRSERSTKPVATR